MNEEELLNELKEMTLDNINARINESKTIKDMINRKFCEFMPCPRKFGFNEKCRFNVNGFNCKECWQYAIDSMNKNDK